MFDGDGLTYDGICKEVYSHLSEVVYFYINDFVRETELRNTVFQYASYLMESLEDVNLIAFFHHVAGEGKTGRTGAYHGNLHSIAWSDRWQLCLTALALVVGCKPLQISYGNRRLVHLKVYALALTLLFLRAHTSTDGRQSRCLFQHLCCSKDITPFYILYEIRDLNIYRTTLNT